MEMIQAKVAEMSPANPVVNIENRVYSGKGRLHWFRFVNRGFFDSEGRLSEIQSVGRDITARKHAEIKLHEYSERLEKMVEVRTKALQKAQNELLAKERLALLGHFAGSMAHEIRNPLGAIDGAVYLLNMKLGGGDEKISEILERVSRNVKKATAIIQSLRDLSRMKKPAAQSHDVAVLIQESLRTCRMPPSITVETNILDNQILATHIRRDIYVPGVAREAIPRH